MISYHAAVFWLLCKKSLCLSTLSIKFKGKVVLKYFDIIFKSLKILCISLNKFRKSEREKSRMGPKNSCAEMSQSFRSQKMVVLIVFSTLELV